MQTSRTRSAIEWADIVGCTLVVGNDADESDFRTVQEAYDNLPPEGGLIVILQGTYQPKATVTLGSKPAIFRGTTPGQTIFSSAGGTVLDLGANAFPLFTLPGSVSPFVTGFSFEDLTLLGTLVAGQHFFTDDAGVNIIALNCFFGGIDRIMDAQNAGTGSGLVLQNCQSFTVNSVLDGPGAVFSTVDSYGSLMFFGGGTVAIGTHTSCRLVTSNFNTLGANVTISLSVLSKIIACRFATADITVDSTFPAGYCRFTEVDLEGGSLTLNAGNNNLVNVGFSSGATLTVNSTHNTVTASQFQGGGTLTEIGGADFNIYSDIDGWTGSVIIGPHSRLNNENVQTVAGVTTLDEWNRTVEANATGGAFTINLPAAATAKFWTYTIKKVDASANVVTIDPAGAETIDGAATLPLSTQYSSVTIQSDGTAWIVISTNGSGSSGVDKFAANRIVSLTAGEGTDLTIATALAALPASGGDIYLKGPGPFPVAAPLDFTTKVVRIRGTGTSGSFSAGPSTIVPAAGISLFKNGAAGCSVEDVTIEGDNASSQVLYEGSTDIRFTRINVHDVAGIIKFAGSQPEVLFRDSFINIPSGITIPLADRFLWKGGAANGTLIFDNVELFITGSGATIMSGVTGSANGPTFKVVNSYTGGGGGGGSTNFWFAQVVDWVGFDIDNAQFQISGARNNIANSNFLDFSIKFLAVWNFITTSNFSQGGTGGGFFDAQLTFDATALAGIAMQNTVSGCNFYGNGVSVKGISTFRADHTAITGCLFSSHTTDAIEISRTVNAQVTGCTFVTTTGGGTRYVDILAGGGLSGRITLSGNTFDGARLAMRCAGFRCTFTGNVLFTVDDTGNVNYYSNNTDLNPAGVAGAASHIENENVVNTSLDTTLDENHRTLTVDASGAARTITLPTAASAKWRKYTVKKMDATANTVTVDGNGAETIDGAASVVLGSQYESVTVQSDGTQWLIV